jgi:hypothetical protein
MIEAIKSTGNAGMGGFIAIAGLLGVFVVLVLFFVLIKIMQKFEKK